MKRVSFHMKLKAGHAEEYQKRHDQIWPELKKLLKHIGIHEYSIFLNPETSELFAYCKVSNQHTLDELPSSPIMKRWWAYMSDIMEVNDDKSPRQTDLVEVFYME